MTAASKAEIAVHKLRNAENGASSGSEPPVGGFYTGTGRNQNTKSKSSFKSKLKSKIALIVLLGGLGGGLAFLGSSNALLMPALQALVYEAVDYQGGSNQARALRILNYSLRGGNTTNGQTEWTGVNKYNGIPDSLKTRLANNGIDIEVNGSNTNMFYNQIDTDGVATRIQVDANNINDLYRTNTGFRSSVDNARYNNISGVYDDQATEVFTRLGLDRNFFKDHTSTGDADADADAYQTAIKDSFDNDSSTINTNTHETFDEPDPDDPTNTIEVERTTTTSDSTDIKNTADINDATTKAGAMLSNVAAVASKAGTLMCGVLRVGTSVAAIVAAHEIYASIDFFIRLSEPGSKTMSGEGNSSPINANLNWFTTGAETTVSDFGGQLSANISGNDSIEINGVTEATESGSPLTDTNLYSMMTKTAPSRSTTGLYSTERAFRPLTAILGSAALLQQTQQTCTAVGITSSLVSIAVSIGSLGASSVVTTIGTKIAKGFMAIATSLAITSALSILIPTMARSLFSNFAEQAIGKTGGAYYAIGASNANSAIARQASGLAPASEDTALAAAKVNSEIAALNAETSRLNSSPFDVTNPNTFLGSIATNLYTATIQTSPLSNANSFIKKTGTAIGSILGTNTYAASSKDTSYSTTFGSQCSNLDSIGAVGDVNCVVIPATDPSTLDTDPNEQNYQAIIAQNMENCDSDGNNCHIKSNSNLYKYITYCDGRTSPFGIPDQNILGDLQATGRAGTLFNSILNAVPFIGDVVDLANNISDAYNNKWGTGEACVASSSNPDWDTEFKYYQRYVQDTRLLNQNGAFSTTVADTTNENDEPVIVSNDPVTIAKQEYADTHPIEQTRTGIYSAISGLTPENTDIALAFIDYYNYIDEYDPTERVALTAHTLVSTTGATVAETLASHRIFITTPKHLESPIPDTAIAKETIIYADLRNRSFAV